VILGWRIRRPYQPACCLESQAGRCCLPGERKEKSAGERKFLRRGKILDARRRSSQGLYSLDSDSQKFPCPLFTCHNDLCLNQSVNDLSSTKCHLHLRRSHPHSHPHSRFSSTLPTNIQRKQLQVAKMSDNIPRKILIAVDCGTTFSAVAWCQTARNDRQYIIKTWPDEHGNPSGRIASEVPTTLVYDGNGKGCRSGYQIKENEPRLERFKLGLFPEGSRQQSYLNL
jgi:hypothetical protein